MFGQGDGGLLVSVGHYGAWTLGEEGGQWLLPSVAAPSSCPSPPCTARHQGEGGRGWWRRSRGSAWAWDPSITLTCHHHYTDKP